MRGTVNGLSRRALLRRSIGLAGALLIAEWAGGTIGFLWPSAAIAARRVRVGTLDELAAANPGLPFADGFPVYVQVAAAFVVVVDPGVGSKRRVVWGRSKKHDFLAPDNGVLTWLQHEDKIVEWREVTNSKLFLAKVSSTFHGRDVFSPVAASLANGLRPDKLGAKIKDPVRLAWPEPTGIRGGLEGVILSCDHFGNVVTNIPVTSIPPKAHIFHKGRDLGPLRTHYAAVPPGRPLAVAGSAGLIEISTRDGDYSARTRARRGENVYVRY